MMGVSRVKLSIDKICFIQKSSDKFFKFIWIFIIEGKRDVLRLRIESFKELNFVEKKSRFSFRIILIKPVQKFINKVGS